MFTKLIHLVENIKNAPREDVFAQCSEHFNQHGLAQNPSGKYIANIIRHLAIKAFLDESISNKDISIDLAGIAGSYSSVSFRYGIYPLNVSHQEVSDMLHMKTAYLQSERMGMGFVEKKVGERYKLFPSDIDLAFKYTVKDSLFYDFTDELSRKVFNQYGVYIEAISSLQSDPLHANKYLARYVIPDFLKDK